MEYNIDDPKYEMFDGSNNTINYNPVGNVRGIRPSVQKIAPLYLNEIDEGIDPSTIREIYNPLEIYNPQENTRPRDVFPEKTLKYRDLEERKSHLSDFSCRDIINHMHNCELCSGYSNKDHKLYMLIIFILVCLVFYLYMKD